MDAIIPRMEAPFVTIAMPCRDEERYIAPCLTSVGDQDYPADRIEVLVADGGSKDATVAVVKAFAQTDPRIRLVENPGRIPATAMNGILPRPRATS